MVTLPILPALAATLQAGPCGDLTFIRGESGRPLTKESFGNEFRQACRAAGVPGSAHGVRKIAATRRAAENGATVAELEAIFGWHGGGMASHYTREADRVRLARTRCTSLRTRSEHLFPHLWLRCGPQRQKINRNNENILRWWAHKDSNLGTR
jgi:hypothetical protein